MVIPVQDYKEVMAMPEAKGKLPSVPYDLALNSCFFETVKAINEHPGRHVVTFSHDDDDRFPRYRDIYREFRRRNPKTAKQIGGFIALDDKEHPPLQAADLAANVTCNLAKQWLDEGRSKPALRQLSGSMLMVGVWEKEYIIDVLRAQR